MMTFEEFKEAGNKCGLFYSTATDEDIQAIYDDGVDAFFNIENLNQFNNN